MRPLERQAAAARSHASLASELLAVRRYLAGAELADLTARRLGRRAEPRHLPRQERSCTTPSSSSKRTSTQRPTRSPASRRGPDAPAEHARPAAPAAQGHLRPIEERRRANAGIIAAHEAADDVATLEESRPRVLTDLEETERGASTSGPECERRATAEEQRSETEVAHAERFRGPGARRHAPARRASRRHRRGTATPRGGPPSGDRSGGARRRAGRTARRHQRRAAHPEQAEALNASQAELAAELRTASRSSSSGRPTDAPRRHPRWPPRAAPPHRGPGRGARVALAQAHRARRPRTARGPPRPARHPYREIVRDDAYAALARGGAPGGLDAAPIADQATLGQARERLTGRGGSLLPVSGPVTGAGAAGQQQTAREHVHAHHPGPGAPRRAAASRGNHAPCGHRGNRQRAGRPRDGHPRR